MSLPSDSRVDQKQASVSYCTPLSLFLTCKKLQFCNMNHSGISCNMQNHVSSSFYIANILLQQQSSHLASCILICYTRYMHQIYATFFASTKKLPSCNTVQHQSKRWVVQWHLLGGGHQLWFTWRRQRRTHTCHIHAVLCTHEMAITKRLLFV